MNGTAQPIRSHADRVLSLAREAAFETVRTARESSVDLGPRATRAQRFGYGLALPFSIMRSVLRDPVARRAYLKAVLLQAAATAIIGFIAIGGTDAIFEFLRTFDGKDGIRVEIPKGWLYLSQLLATVSLVEWCVIAVSRQYHNDIGRRASLLIGITPEDPDIAPRVQVDLRWMLTKARRRLRGMKVFACGMPVFALLQLIPFDSFGPQATHHLVSKVAASIWGLYWLAVFLTAKTAYAWTEEYPGDPWFLRAWTFAVTNVPGLRWRVPRAYGRLWRRFSEAVFAPAEKFERSPFELAGVALVRMVLGVPVVYLFVRPFLPVAAARIVLAQSAEIDRQSGLVIANSDAQLPSNTAAVSSAAFQATGASVATSLRVSP